MAIAIKRRHYRLFSAFLLVLFLYFGIALFLVGMRRQAAVDYVREWAAQEYGRILKGEPIDGSTEELLVRSFYYAVAKPFAVKSVSGEGTIFEGGSNSLVAIAVGAAEGTRGVDGSKDPAWWGHEDPCKGWGACPERGRNMGTFSYDGAATPEQADEVYIQRLQSEAAEIKEYAASIGLEMSLEEFLNGIDLANQAPLAALGRMGYPDRLLEAKNMGLAGQEAIAWARSRSFISPATGKLNAPGFGNSMPNVEHDQKRRIDRIADAIAANPDLVPTEEPPTIADDMPAFIAKLKSSGALKILEDGVTTTPNGVTEIEKGAFTTALNYMKVCGWSDYGCELEPPDGTSPESLYNDMLWELGYAQGVKQADKPAAIAEGFASPVDMNLPGVMITSEFGWRTHPILGDRLFHSGLDIGGPAGTPILAAKAGVITFSGWNDGGYGYLVEIKHDDGTLTLYAHNQGVYFDAGTYVEQGVAIAEMGSTGLSTGPHLHFEIIPAGKSQVNPCEKLDIC